MAMTIDTTNLCSHLQKKLFEPEGIYYPIWQAMQNDEELTAVVRSRQLHIYRNGKKILILSENILVNALVQIAGCTVLGFGIAMEVKCGSVTMPGEGISIAIQQVTGWPFPKAKIRVDISLVVIAVVLSFLLLGSWKWDIVGIGTLFAMVYIGITVRLFNKHLAWFDRLLHYRPGCCRYVYGLARYIKRQM